MYTVRLGCLVLMVLAGGLGTACKHAEGGGDSAAPAGAAASGGSVEMLPMQVVTANSLNVRAIPSTKGTVLGTLKKGMEVRVLEEKNGWKKVQSDGALPEGWVAGEYLKAHGAPAAPQ
ncbi:MAG TPA: SH3 domain-containing protein [Myxococcota bacterium]|nr:SH3 domain-containing protein [Myxococcota bacterium]